MTPPTTEAAVRRRIITSLYGICLYPRCEIFHQLDLQLRAGYRRSWPLYRCVSRFVVSLPAADQRHPRGLDGDAAQSLDAVLRGDGHARLRGRLLRDLFPG